MVFNFYWISLEQQNGNRLKLFGVINMAFVASRENQERFLIAGIINLQ